VNKRTSSDAQVQPLELILARNLISILSLAAFLVDVDGALIYYNDAAAQVMGARFEERREISREEWSGEIGPFDEQGTPIPYDELPLTAALRDGRPGYGRFFIQAEGGLLEILASAVPLVGPSGNNGAMVIFWPVPEEG
jgi:PAS domain-containing protein